MMETETAGPRRPWVLREVLDRLLSGGQERTFVLLLLVAVPVIIWILPGNLALFDFLFLPALLTGFFLSARSAVLFGALSLLVILFFTLLRPESFTGPRTASDLYLHLSAWGGFLVLSAAVVGLMSERLKEDLHKMQGMVGAWKTAQEALQRRMEVVERQNGALDGIRQKMETALYSAMDPHVAHMIVNKRLVNEKREMSVLFADIANFTATVENMDPEAVVHHTNRLFMELEPIIVAYNGHLDKFIGDCLMAEFGIPQVHVQNPLQAVLAGLQIQKRVASPDFSWKLRVGIAYGEALAGLVGSQHRKSYTALGDVVNVAARLQKLCPVGSVCVDGATHDRVSRWFHVRPLFGGRQTDQDAAVQERLADLKARLGSSRADYELIVEAARLSGELGETQQAVELYRRALEVNPGAGERIEACVAELVADKPRPGVGGVRLRGKQKSVRSYEVLSLKDPLDDPGRLPASLKSYAERLLKDLRIDRDSTLPVEALDGSIGHGLVAAALAGSVADGMGLGQVVERTAFKAGFYHDMGMRNVPEHLLNQDALAGIPEQDMQMIRVHVEAAPMVLDELGVRLDPEAAAAIESHHENADGTGYPKRLRGSDIPVAGRILRAVNEYHELISPRPWGRALPAADAMTQLKAFAERGVLDGDAAAALIAFLRRGL